MALYLGSSKELKINFANSVRQLIIPSPAPIVNGTILLSADNYILTDNKGIYITAKEDK
jgi:hypothetical protein